MPLSGLISTSRPNRINQDVSVVASSFPHGISSQTVVLDEFSLRHKRLRIIERNHDLRGGVVNVGLIKCVFRVSPLVGVDCF